MKHRNENFENKVLSTNPRKLFEKSPTLFADNELNSSSKRKNVSKLAEGQKIDLIRKNTFSVTARVWIEVFTSYKFKDLLNPLKRRLI